MQAVHADHRGVGAVQCRRMTRSAGVGSHVHDIAGTAGLPVHGERGPELLTRCGGQRQDHSGAAGSAGGRFPLEVYVAVPEGSEQLPPGVHWYHPEEHALIGIAPPPSTGAPAIVVTGVPWRTGWRYRERGYRHTYWDSGTMLSQLLAAADSAGLAASLYSRFPDRAVPHEHGHGGSSSPKAFSR